MSCSTRSGPTRLRMPTLAQPAAGPARGPWVRRGMRAGRRSCVTRNGHVDVEWPARSPRSQDWSRGRRRRDVHASTRSSRGPCTANGPGRAHSRLCRLIVQRGQLRRGPRAAHGPSCARCRRYPAEHAARCRSCGVADGVVNQVSGPSGTASGSSELVKAHNPRRGRPSCRNTAQRVLVLPLSRRAGCDKHIGRTAHAFRQRRQGPRRRGRLRGADGFEPYLLSSTDCLCQYHGRRASRDILRVWGF